MLHILYFHLPIGAVSCLSRAFVLGILVSSQALLARRKRVGFEPHLILFSTFSFLMAAEVFGLFLSLLDAYPETHLPPAMPRFTRELRQLWEDRGRPRLPRRPPDVHDALVDARDQLRRYRLITSDGDYG